MAGSSSVIISSSRLILLASFLLWTAAATPAVGIDTTALPVVAFEDGYTRVFGDDNLMLHRDGKTVHISLDQRTGRVMTQRPRLATAGSINPIVDRSILVSFPRPSLQRRCYLLLEIVSESDPHPSLFLSSFRHNLVIIDHLVFPTGAGFASQELYLHGFFGASIKLPSDYAAGVVVAFYMSNADVFESNHDELDFEFLGNVRGREWRVQTNVYANGSTSQGREERYGLWFDPTAEHHNYAILWTADRIIFSIDSIPIREIVRSPPSMGSSSAAFPAKPMSLYATIWDGSTWATAGGRYRVNYKHAPFVAQFTDLLLHGCAVDPTDHSSTCDADDNSGRRWRFDGFALSPAQRAAMASFREDHMTYSYCYDRRRYPTPLTECDVDPTEAKRLRGVMRFRGRHAHHLRRNKQHQGQRDGQVKVRRGAIRAAEA